MDEIDRTLRSRDKPAVVDLEALAVEIAARLKELNIDAGNAREPDGEWALVARKEAALANLAALAHEVIEALDRIESDPDFEPDVDQEPSFGWPSFGAGAVASWLTDGGLWSDDEA